VGRHGEGVKARARARVCPQRAFAKWSKSDAGSARNPRNIPPFLLFFFGGNAFFLSAEKDCERAASSAGNGEVLPRRNADDYQLHFKSSSLTRF